MKGNKCVDRKSRSSKDFMGSCYIAGYWYRESIGMRTVLLDEDGSEIVLMRGKSFIIVTNVVTGVRYSEL